MPKMYFIGVTTAQSSIHRILPRWAELAGIPNAELAGIDIPVGGVPAQYRAAVETIRDDADGYGALVTTHKVGIYEHAGDLFTEFDDDARLLGEVSCIVKRGEKLSGIAMDTVAGPLALQTLDWRGESALILGAGGAGLALAASLSGAVTLTDIAERRLEKARALTGAQCVLVSSPSDNDRVLEAMPPGSLIVNATGMGKDRPGSPISAQARFPAGAIAWDFNYRGELLFLDYARSQGVRAVDGWTYFLHGWSQIMSRVFGFALTPELFEAMCAAASSISFPRVQMAPGSQSPSPRSAPRRR
jgi:shikimate 5-dehydrogenase